MLNLDSIASYLPPTIFADVSVLYLTVIYIYTHTHTHVQGRLPPDKYHHPNELNYHEYAAMILNQCTI